MNRNVNLVNIYIRVYYGIYYIFEVLGLIIEFMKWFKMKYESVRWVIFMGVEIMVVGVL